MSHDERTTGHRVAPGFPARRISYLEFAPAGVRWFEDYVPGLEVDLGSVTLTEAEIIEFGRRYDPQPIHTDPAVSPFGGVIASGWHTAAAVMRVVVDRYLSPVASLPSPGVDELRWLRPVRPGDRLAVTAAVLDRRISRSKPDRGLVRSRMVAFDPTGDEAMTMTAIGFVLLDPVPRGA